MILHGDSLEVLKTLEANSVDAVVTDPPYGLKFMGKKWDYDVPSKELWAEVLRVLKPGGHLLSFGGTRTYHRMVVQIEDAGFEIRDQIMWLYGSGFPKSHDVSKAIDKAAGITEWKETKPNPAARPGNGNQAETSTGWAKPQRPPKPVVETDLAKQWQGFGTALKPANEPIVLARKPLEKGLTIAENVLKWGCGALNIDGSRIEANDQAKLEKNWDREQSDTMETDRPSYGKFGAIDLRDRAPQGRWPANVIFDEEAAQVLDEMSGLLKSGAINEGGSSGTNFSISGELGRRPPHPKTIAASSGGASRFFYVAKASKRERNAGLEGMPKKLVSVWGGDEDDLSEGKKSTIPRQNHHPTVKPIKLMRYLTRLITPPNGLVLDPFCGSGSTGVACKKEGFEFIGIEREEQYVEIAKKRVGA